VVQANLGKNYDPISKITRAKRAEVLAQAVEWLPSKCEVLSSNPCATERERERERERED
jgi:hypothetical protein